MGKGCPRVALFLAAVLFSSALPADDQQQKQAELNRLKARIEALQAQLGKARGNYDQVRAELRRTETSIGEIAPAVRRLDNDLRSHSDKLRSLERRKGELEREASAQRSRLAAQLRSAYAMGRQEYLKVLLNQEDPAAVGRVMRYYGYLNQARTERIGTLVGLMEELKAVGREVKSESAQVVAARERHLQELTVLERHREDRRRLMEMLKREILTKDQQLARMNADRNELEAVIAALKGALADIPDQLDSAFGSQRGDIPWPVKGALEARFGAPRAGGKLRWQGVLIAAPEGQVVRAVSRGRVAFADWLRGYGLLLIVDHGDGYMSLYGHNQTLTKGLGEWVKAGEPIATVGNSGGRERPALYFEIRYKGKPTDPRRWFNRG